ncbi:hypothetical protein GCU56_10410 [Geodermatophilus sabuli]|uniref:Right handed beta helix domain-containing protein n=1 Tax=Geodermatophilus sabuli TaxID=1564158 RepID=A0A7K3W095_9ACTN|nr:right-handed parallel beta-helix repeat-containing protein [Geodermatophilus sabuli]NEK58282.1 hypothetical protein [Geodermatophilus sabuli]
MHIRRARIPLVASVALATTMAMAGPAAADGGYDRGGHHQDRGGGGHEVVVRHGESIQEAVRAAEPGTTIHVEAGTYPESVTIRKDGITLRGHGTVISPPEDAERTDCETLFPAPPGEEQPPASGICILGDVTVPDFEADPTAEITVNDPVSHVTVEGVTVAGAPFDGLIGVGTTDLTVRDSKFEDNGGYGAASFTTERTAFHGNAAVGNTEAGFYVGDSPESGADVRRNYSADNAMGFFFRNASHGEARGNVAEENCLGILVLAGAPGPATHWQIKGNEVRANNGLEGDRAEICASPPPVTGAGILLVGAQDVEVRRNLVTGHVATGESLVSGGIVVRGTLTAADFPPPAEGEEAEEFPPPILPTGEVEDNVLHDNRPDVFARDAEGMEFDDNRCGTSDPVGLCG